MDRALTRTDGSAAAPAVAISVNRVTARVIQPTDVRMCRHTADCRQVFVALTDTGA